MICSGYGEDSRADRMSTTRDITRFLIVEYQKKMVRDQRVASHHSIYVFLPSTRNSRDTMRSSVTDEVVLYFQGHELLSPAAHEPRPLDEARAAHELQPPVEERSPDEQQAEVQPADEVRAAHELQLPDAPQLAC